MLIMLCFRLHQLVGNSILFASEEATTATWCGYPGRPCIRCTDKIKGHDDVLKCADRMMTIYSLSFIFQFTLLI
jgi:hypothetical protein